jgi:hypothetical protein
MFNSNNSIWSGALLTKPEKQFSYITGTWYVPVVFYPFAVWLPGDFDYSAAAVWVGLDDGGQDLYQSGTDSEIFASQGWGSEIDATLPWIFTVYWVWIESLPFAPWAVPNFPVSPGDQISVAIFLADENGTTWYENGFGGGLTSADNCVWFVIENLTQQNSYFGYLPRAAATLNGQSSTGYTGTTAEFILERPEIVDNGASYTLPLACFGASSMFDCVYEDSATGSNWIYPLGAPRFTPGTLTYLNMRNPATQNVLAIAVPLPDPNSNEGGQEIFWMWTNFL